MVTGNDSSQPLLSRIERLFTHICSSPRSVSRVLGPTGNDQIAAAVRQSEQQHRGQIVVFIEHALEPRAVIAGQCARERAIELFSQHRVWDTQENNGVLLYLLLAERDIEIVADRGVECCVAPGTWKQICERVEVECRAGKVLDGILSAIEGIGTVLTQHFPVNSVVARDNELPDRAVIR